MPLTRIRRRILIATLVGVGVAFSAWPRRKVDDRFVGSWQMMSGPFVVLSADGTGTTDSILGPGKLNWWSDGRHFYAERSPSTMKGHLRHWAAKLSGNDPTFRVAIKDIQPDFIYFSDSTQWVRMTWDFTWQFDGRTLQLNSDGRTLELNSEP